MSAQANGLGFDSLTSGGEPANVRAVSGRDRTDDCGPGNLGDQRGEGSRWRDLLGPVATSRAVTALLGITRSELDGARRRREVLGVRTASGQWVYPMRQFHLVQGEVVVLDGLQEVLRAFRPDPAGIAASRWLATPNRRLDSLTPWAVLISGESVDAVAAAAEAHA